MPRRRHPRIRLPRLVIPRAIERDYRLMLVGHVRRMKRRAHKLLLPHVQRLLELRAPPARSDEEGFDFITELLREIARESQLELFALQDSVGSIFARTNKAHKRAFLRQFRDQGIQLQLFDEPLLQAYLDDIVPRNIDLIHTLDAHTLEQVEKVTREAIYHGLRPDDFALQLDERFAVGQSHAILLARDQYSKAMGQLNERRQRDLGITHYIWQNSKDERVRGRHRSYNGRSLDGQRFAWNNPPPVGHRGERVHPGQDYQCRCTAGPDIEDLLGRLEAA